MIHVTLQTGRENSNAENDLFTNRKQNTKQKPTRGKKHNQRTMNTTETQNKHRLRTRRPNQETYDNEQIMREQVGELKH